jgi:M6 family metalloprotease-like protein
MVHHLSSPLPRALGRRGALIAVLAVVMLCLGWAGNAHALSGNQKLVVVLCKFPDKTNEPQPPSFFQAMFAPSSAGGSSLVDYWKEVSYGQLDPTGSVVKGWYTVDLTLAQWQAKEGAGGDRAGLIDACAKKADPDVDFNDYAGVVVITNQDNLSEDLFGKGPPTTINGTTYNNLGQMDTEWDQAFNGIQHESGHAFRLNHSRKLTVQSGQSDYGDIFDVMSCLGCVGTSTTYGTGGPALNVVQLDTAGWVAPARKTTIDNSSCSGQQTITMAALNHPEVSGILGAQIPASIPIAITGVSTTGDRYAVEFREKSSWDGGILQDGVLIHLHGVDNYSYWVDSSGIAGTGVYLSPGGSPAPTDFSGRAIPMSAGMEYVDTANKAFVAVNRVDRPSHTALITTGGCKFNSALSTPTPTNADFGDSVTLSSTLTVSGGSTPVPGQKVTLTLGTQSCDGTTDSSGVASCAVTITQHPGATTLSAAFAGDPAYNSANSSTPFTINKEATKLTYTGATTADYHDAFTASATLEESDGGGAISGKSVTLTLGSGDTCTATTNASGSASCSITVTQQPGASTIKAAFAGDGDYVSSSADKPFTITKEQTTTTYTGPNVILLGASGATLTGKLVEDDGTPIAGRTLTLSLGGQSCTGTTGSGGVATCTLTPSGATGSQTLGASFAGDAFYLPSSAASSSATVFSFPAGGGSFVIGDGATGTVTFWGNDWDAKNVLSGGAAPSAFKGFADIVPLPTKTPPAACGGRWTTRPGNSSKPPDAVPAYMGVVVASKVTKDGSTIAGDTKRIVVVKTNPGYGPSPGKAGTGTVVATYC